MPEKHHISVCVCTYKRPLLLNRLLMALERQETDSLFEYSMIIVDNDRSESGRQTVDARAGQSSIAIRYCLEPEQNIALARNKAIANSKGNFIAFIDDDEVPASRWLINHYKALTLFDTAGVLGPVLPLYEAPPPKWILEGRFFERPVYFSGYFLNWDLTRTGNCLLKRAIFEEDDYWFDPQFGSGGEDRDFFKRKIARGHVFVWCNEAPIFEAVPPERWQKRAMLKRALLRGKMTYNSERQRPGDVMSSVAAVLYYSVNLPFLFLFSPVFGFDVFMKTLVRDCDHLGKIFAMLKINIVKDRYIT
jgi:glycosyltransferase involved in cell wall biosynthesis